MGPEHIAPVGGVPRQRRWPGDLRPDLRLCAARRSCSSTTCVPIRNMHHDLGWTPERLAELVPGTLKHHSRSPRDLGPVHFNYDPMVCSGSFPWTNARRPQSHRHAASPPRAQRRRPRPSRSGPLPSRANWSMGDVVRHLLAARTMRVFLPRIQSLCIAEDGRASPSVRTCWHPGRELGPLLDAFESTRGQLVEALRPPRPRKRMRARRRGLRAGR
jgi:hypothetical protein